MDESSGRGDLYETTGFVLSAVGLTCLLVQFSRWEQLGMGALTGSIPNRIMTALGVALPVGLQTVLASFYWNLLSFIPEDKQDDEPGIA